MAKRPLIAIFGTTGVGKSNLAVEIATNLFRGGLDHEWKGARIINADAMQVYSGMDIITNKIPEKDRNGIEHLLMGFKQPGEQYVVGQWVQDAIKAIEETHKMSQVPIVVGGTAYWIQHLIFPNHLVQPEPLSSSAKLPEYSNDLLKSISLLPSELLTLFNTLPQHPPSASENPALAYALYNLLNALDPPVAARWHWRDTRKVLRNLCIVKETGKRPSEIIAQQSEKAIKPRYRTLCYWLYAEPSALNPRLDDRVDTMIQQGLLDEIINLRTTVAARQPDSLLPGTDTDYTLGIFQSIGYREFHGYLTMPKANDNAFREAVENMKHATRKYAKRQISWIRNKLLPMIHASNAEEHIVPTYLLDATVLGDNWRLQVLEPALRITETFLANKELPDASTVAGPSNLLRTNHKAIDPTSVLKSRRKVICPVCTVDSKQPCMIEDGPEWRAHQRNKVHRRLAAKVNSKPNHISKHVNELEPEDMLDYLGDCSLSILGCCQTYSKLTA